MTLNDSGRLTIRTNVSTAIREPIATQDWLIEFELSPYARELNPVDLARSN